MGLGTANQSASFQCSTTPLCKNFFMTMGSGVNSFIVPLIRSRPSIKASLSNV